MTLDPFLTFWAGIGIGFLVTLTAVLAVYAVVSLGAFRWAWRRGQQLVEQFDDIGGHREDGVLHLGAHVIEKSQPKAKKPKRERIGETTKKEMLS